MGRPGSASSLAADIFQVQLLVSCSCGGFSPTALRCFTALHLANPVVHIPKSTVLSVKSSSKSEHIAAEPYGHGAHLALALAVYIEV
jgi:hypothetical protein